MSRYIAVGSYQIDLQEGDAGCTIDFVIPAEIDMTSRSAKMMVRKDHNTKPIITKVSGSGITKSGQNLSVAIVADDTKGRSGIWHWDLEVYTSTADIITVGRGTVNIISEITTQ